MGAYKYLLVQNIGHRLSVTAPASWTQALISLSPAACDNKETPHSLKTHHTHTALTGFSRSDGCRPSGPENTDTVFGTYQTATITRVGTVGGTSASKAQHDTHFPPREEWFRAAGLPTPQFEACYLMVNSSACVNFSEGKLSLRGACVCVQTSSRKHTLNAVCPGPSSVLSRRNSLLERRALEGLQKDNLKVITFLPKERRKQNTQPAVSLALYDESDSSLWASKLHPLPCRFPSLWTESWGKKHWHFNQDRSETKTFGAVSTSCETQLYLKIGRASCRERV